jgi:hypothetical protein
VYGGNGGVRLRWYVNAVNDAGNAGAFYQLRHTENIYNYGFVWWNPIKQFKLTYGTLDGARPFGVLWGLNVGDFANAGGPGGGGGDIFDGVGSDTYHSAFVQLYPVDGLEIAVGFNPTSSGTEAAAVYARTQAYVGYTIPGIGVAALGYFGNSGFFLDDDTYQNPKLEFAFNLTAVENLIAQLGVKIPFASTKGRGVKSAQDEFEVALAADFTSADTFGVRAHLKTTFGKKLEYDVTPSIVYYEGPFYFGIGLSPWYNLGIGKVGIDLNIGFAGASKSSQYTPTELTSYNNEYMIWEVTPYFEKGFSGGAFLIGFKIGALNFTNSDFGVDDGNGLIKWEIPIALGFNF